VHRFSRGRQLGVRLAFNGRKFRHRDLPVSGGNRRGGGLPFLFLLLLARDFSQAQRSLYLDAAIRFRFDPHLKGKAGRCAYVSS
jgi:hypothetical protein